MLFAWRSGYCCANSAPVSGSYTWLVKAIGWVQAQQAVTMYVLVDDAINTWYSLAGELGSDGANWASGGVGIVNSWTDQSIQASPFTGTIPFGTRRFDLHYANVDATQDALMVWFNTVSYTHLTLPTIYSV